jgi:hypothetical protein
MRVFLSGSLPAVVALQHVHPRMQHIEITLTLRFIPNDACMHVHTQEAVYKLIDDLLKMPEGKLVR